MRLAAAALLFAFVTAAADSSAAAFLVGALRRDGVVIPFAAYDGKKWSAPWPLPEFDRAIPINTTSVPKGWWGKAGIRDVWQAWIAGTATTLRVKQPDAVGVHCTRQIGLKSDYRAAEPPPPPTAQPYPKDGVAVSPPRPVEPIAILQPGALELLPIWPTVRDAFNKAERETASRFDDPVREKTRERYDPQIEAAYAYGIDRRIYYVEVSRMYRAPAGDDCAVAFGTGWIAKTAVSVGDDVVGSLAAGDTYSPLAMTVDLLPCNRYGASYMLPFGVMTFNGHTYWLAQFSGWDHERFVVVDVKPKDVEAVVNVWEGAC